MQWNGGGDNPSVRVSLFPPIFHIKADKIALMTAIFLFTFDLVPSTANLIATYVSQKHTQAILYCNSHFITFPPQAFYANLSTIIGPYRQMTGAMNALGCALIYWRYFERKWAQH